MKAEKEANEKLLYKLIEEMNGELKKSRFLHSLGVCYTAANLAQLYNCDVTKASIAGILHDCAKMYSDDELIKICNKNNIPINKYEIDNGYLLHAKVGSFIAQTKYSIDDEEILNAIKWHTTGTTNMTLLDKIIFISDYIEPSRTKQPNLKEIRELAFISTNINLPLLKIMDDTINYLKSTGKVIDYETLKAYEYYKQL